MFDTKVEDEEEPFSSKKDIRLNGYNVKRKQLDKGMKKRNQLKTARDHAKKQAIELDVRNACMLGHLNIIQQYLESYSVNDVLLSGWTPLLYAALYAHAEVIDYLLKNGADANRHKDGYTPLMALCNSKNYSKENSLTCLKLLINAKANVNAFNKDRETALMYACQSQEVEFVAEIIKYIKNINACDNVQKSALMYAVMSNKPDIVRILLENGADASLTDYNNITAEEIASMKRYTEILSLLNSDKNEILNTCEVFTICDWKDMFPMLATKNYETIDSDVSTILYGMGLEKYSSIFRGVSLKAFLKLTEVELDRLGLDLNVHRIQFMEYLHKFHRKKWSMQSIGVINKSSPYTIYDGVTSLGTIAKQIGVLGSSFQYINNALTKAPNKNVHLTNEQILKYAAQLKKTRQSLHILKSELLQIKTLAQNVQIKNSIGIPAIYIGKKKRKVNWPAIISITAIIGVCVSKAACIQKFLTLT